MNSTLMVGVSGVRWIVGTDLTPELVARYAAAFGAWAGNGRRRAAVVLGRDARTSGPMFAMAATAGLVSVGSDVIDVGLVTTPGAQLAVEINAGNDVNGNTRRAMLVFGLDDEYPSVAILCDVIEEHYNYPDWVRELPYVGQFHVPVRRYRAYLKRKADAS